jgi:phosphohistidine swiveling domain-containing protein
MAKDTVNPVLWLGEITQEQRSLVGGKAAALGALRRAGLPVPDGFCISIEVAREGIDTHWAAVADAYRQLTSDGRAVAVRSSGVAEDSARASFAGQYETILNVQDVVALRSAIEQCWRAASSPRVRAYLAQYGYEDGDERLPLLVQRQVPATVSGVLFTSDPLCGSDEEMLIEAGSGTGEALVSGRTVPVRYRVSRQGRVRALSSQELLTPVQCRVLAELGARIEHVLGPGQDVEWAVVGQQVYVLQARPITRSELCLPLSQLWTRANVGEVLPHAITPLTWAVFQATLLNQPALAEEESDDCEGESRGIIRVHGRAYIRLDCLLDSFCYLPSVTPQVIGQVLGVNLPAAHFYARPTGLSVRLAQGAFVLDALGLLPRLAGMVGRMPSPPSVSSGNLVRLMAWTARCFRLHLKCTAYAIGAFGLLDHLLNQWIPDEAEIILPQILTGSDDLQTAAQGVSLWRLAKQVKQNPAWRQILEAGLSWPATAQELSGVDGGLEFLKTFQAFMETNGARAAGEFELAVPRWREDPSFVLGVLRKYLETQETTLDRDGSTPRHRRRQQAVSRIKASLRPLQKRIFVRLLASYSNYTTLRENVKYRLMEGYALIRQIFLEMGTDLAARGSLDKAGDIFFLTPSEALALNAGQELAREANTLLAERQVQHANWESLDPPTLITDDERELAWPQGDALTGIGCSPGTVEGIARVLSDPSEAHMLRPGEILVALHTDPGWTPLFLSCKAVVTEIGGFLSHGATVAREYGIPAVVNVRGATSMIRAGDWITVDGSKGTVVLHKNRQEMTQ